MKKAIARPLVSFCISTYQRFDLLDRMMGELLKQEYAHFEVIICDNDPKGSSRKVVEKYASPKLKYFANPRNLGMVDSFNRALSLSKGDFIVFMSDDDPPYPCMLADLVDLYQIYPECDSYFGAYDLYTPDSELATTIKMPVGFHSCRNMDWPRNSVKIFNPRNYLRKALQGDIFYYLMWSTGMVKREVVEKVGAIPKYGSALMTDRSYCLKVGSMGRTLIYNKELASQLVHTNSFSLTLSAKSILYDGFVGFYNDILPYIKKYNLEAENEQFIVNHLINMFMIMKVGDEMRHQKTNVNLLMSIFDEISQQLPFLARHKLWLRLMLINRFPFELMFKVLQVPPHQLLKKSYRFLRSRQFNQGK